MRLQDYIRMNGYNYRSFAKELDTHWRNIESWAKGDRMPRWAEAEKLFIFTDNQVTGTDLYEEQIQRKKAIIQRNKV